MNRTKMVRRDRGHSEESEGTIAAVTMTQPSQV